MTEAERSALGGPRRFPAAAELGTDETIEALLQRLRDNPPRAIGGRPAG